MGGGRWQHYGTGNLTITRPYTYKYIAVTPFYINIDVLLGPYILLESRPYQTAIFTYPALQEHLASLTLVGPMEMLKICGSAFFPMLR